MPTLALTSFNIVLGEHFYMSEALISLLAGLVFSPRGANFIRPLEYAGSEENLDAATLSFTRLVLGVQLLFAGGQLPSRYLRQEWKPLGLLLRPLMAAMWVATSLLVWALIPRLPFLHALAIGACVTPTDPVLSNVIVKGRLADKNVPKDLQSLIIAESGANDGLGYPFLFFALYLIKYVGDGGRSELGGAGLAMSLWVGETMGYTIIFSVVYGAFAGWAARVLLHLCEERRIIDHESFVAFAFSLALFITGTCGMIGTDDILACFVAGNVFNWDDRYRLETLDEVLPCPSSLQPTIDMLLNVTVFMWYGAVCPWYSFPANSITSLPRLILLAILVLLFRRLPSILVLRKRIPQIESLRHAVFMGFFGPISCSAIFWDVAHLREAVSVLVWFMVISSVVVHGLSIPIVKLGFYLPRSISGSPSSSEGSPGPDPTGVGSSRKLRPVSVQLVYRVLPEHVDATSPSLYLYLAIPDEADGSRGGCKGPRAPTR
ncbi:Cation/H+ exchanger [Durotheca rogersii]|uniref:Cation/H+ exchanger n=1 Tax=Durotheca rogersii TaxID=419775 RepID=UPI00222116CD|nr:Cation/H+ exchanger [Durotheca rogersii]KAI5862329.1 Cation/H+ exchanger [Durotheca rogersii]